VLAKGLGWFVPGGELIPTRKVGHTILHESVQVNLQFPGRLFLRYQDQRATVTPVEKLGRQSEVNVRIPTFDHELVPREQMNFNGSSHVKEPPKPGWRTNRISRIRVG
jgi:hypothetical protein